MTRVVERDQSFRSFRCSACGGEYVMDSRGENSGAGYGVTNDARGTLYTCYTCAGNEESKQMMATGSATLHLTHRRVRTHRLAPMSDQWFVVNWPNTLRFPAIGADGDMLRAPRDAKNIKFWFVGPDGVLWRGRSDGTGTASICLRYGVVDPRRPTPLPMRAYLRRFAYYDTPVEPGTWVKDLPMLRHSEPVPIPTHRLSK